MTPSSQQDQKINALLNPMMTPHAKTPRLPPPTYRKPPLPDAGAFDCTHCGACCDFFRRVEASDVDTSNPEIARHISDGAMRQRNRRCTALKGAIGCKTSCRIYENRSAICQAFPKGSQSCLDARAKFGLDLPIPDATISVSAKGLEIRVDEHIVGRFARNGMFIAIGPGTDPMYFSHEHPVCDTSTAPTKTNWSYFVENMRRHHNVRIKRHLRPLFLGS
jgi:Fe-S-cluster containining protein